MGKKNLKKNYIYNLSYQIILLLTPFITTPYISRVLGADGVGIVSYVESVASYFVLFAAMGITAYGQREISYVQDNKTERSRVFWNAKVLELITTAVALGVYIIFSINQENKVIYYVYTINIINVVTDITWFFQGLEEFKKITVRNLIIKLVGIIYVFTFIKKSEDVVVYAIGLTLFTFLGNALMWLYMPKYVVGINKVKLNPFKDVSVILALFLPAVATQVYTVLDKTMIGLITKDSFENGYYEQAMRISRMVLTVITSLGTVMIPRIGFHFQKDNKEEIRRLMYKSYRFVWFMGIPLCFGLIMISDNFVPWFFGPGYDKVAILLKILAFLIIAIGISTVSGSQYLIPTKREKEFNIAIISGAAVNLFMNIFLINILGCTGAAIASVAAESLISVIMLIMIRKELSIPTILYQGRNYFIAGIVMSLLLYFMNRYMAVSILNTIIMVICGAVSYIGILLIMKDSFLNECVTMVVNKLRKRN